MCAARLAEAALYHGNSCARFIGAAEQMQVTMLASAELVVRPHFLRGLDCLLEEACTFFREFSSRWGGATITCL